MPYRVQLVEKTVERDHVDDGADPSTTRSTMGSGDHKAREAETLAAALSAAFADFDLPTSYLFVGNGYVSCNRNEDGAANPVEGSVENPEAVRLSEIGQLYLCDYTFSVEYIERRTITLDELRAAFPHADIDGEL